MNPKNFFAELKRRNVYKVAVAYAVIAWLLIQAASIVLPTFDAPGWTMKVLIAALAIGFPLAVVLAWAFEITPEGIVRAEDVPPNESITRRTGRKLTAIILFVALIAAGLFTFQRFKPASPAPARKEGPPASSPAPAILEKSIAVLPFENRSEDKANAYFADGIQDEILTRLAKIADLKVISRTSTLRFKDAPGDLREIAHQLGVAHILEGSVQKSADHVRITVQLINAATDSHLWAETFDRKLIDVFSVESEVAQRIATSLEAKLSGREKSQIATLGTKNPAAYDAYLHAVSLRNGQSRADADKCVEYSRQAVELDPDYADAWALLSMAASTRFAAFDNTAADRELARTAAEKAIALGPDLGSAHNALGHYYYYCLKEYGRALAEFEEARKRSPNDPISLHVIALVGRRQGKLEESLQLQQQVAALDPLNQDVWVNLGRTLRSMRRLAEAREMYDHALSIAPGDPQIIGEKAGAYLAEGNLDAAEQLLADVPIAPRTAAYENKFQSLIYRRQFDQAIAMQEEQLRNKDAPAQTLALTRAGIARLHALAGRWDVAQPLLFQARAELRKLPQEGAGLRGVEVSLLQINAWLGDRPEVEAGSEALLEDARKDPDVWSARRRDETVARAYARLRDADRAMPLLTRALSQQYTQALTPAMLRLDPIWDPIRNDPRFQKLSEERKP